MRANNLTKTVKTAVLGTTVLLLLAVVSFAQTINLTAAPASALLPDGQSVPMWGYSCNDAGTGATCAALGGAGSWSPVLITVPVASSGSTNLTINLTNNLPAGIPTSLTIVGQLGGGLGVAPGGNGATTAPSPTHAQQAATWPIAGDSTGVIFTPPPQLPRVQSFGTEVPNGANAVALTWSNLREGTYLIESGTHPSIQGPMGLYGVLVVTTAGAPPIAYHNASAYKNGTVSYDVDTVALLSEIDAVQNRAVDTAVNTAGFSETSARVLRDTVSSVTVAQDQSQTPEGGTGYTVGAAITFSQACDVQPIAHVSGVSNGAITDISLDNPGKGCSSVPTATAAGGTGAQLVVALTLSGVMCSDNAGACYPPVVNYDPRYYLVNGKAFDKTNPGNSLLLSVGSTGSPVTFSNGVLLRLVNAGVRMHVPSVAGLPMSLVAEDGNVLPGLPRTQSEVFLAAGKVYDVMLKPAGTATASAYGLFDRALSLSMDNVRDGGMQAYLSINGGQVPQAAVAGANDDQYFLPLPAGKTLVVSDPGKGVIANDLNIYGVKVSTPPTGAATNGFTLNADGTFSYTPASGTTSDSFTYCGNGASSGPACATVILAACTGDCKGGAPTATDDSYTSNVASRIQIAPPGVLENDTDPQGHPLTASVASNVAGGSVTLNPDGSFTATPTTAPTGNTTATVTFQYAAVNSQGTASTNAGTVTVTFNGGSGLKVSVLDAPSTLPGNTPQAIQDYRWIIEEDRTVLIDPTDPKGQGGPGQQLGTNFHTSYMPVIASGCIGPTGNIVACEYGQTVLDTNPQSSTYLQHVPTTCDIGNGVCRTDNTAGQQTPLDPADVHLDPNKRYYLTIFPGDAGNSFSSGAGAPVPINPGNPNGPTRPFSIAQDCGPYSLGAANWAPGTGTCGHGMGGAPLAKGQTSATVTLEETPFQTAKISVFVFEDDFPLNGESDAGGGVDILATNEPGLGGFEITLFDDAGGTGDATGQMTYDMFNMPLSNSLAGTIDPTNGNDACPISKNPDGLVGMIVTCPKYESDGTTLSPLAGQAVIANMMPGRYGVVATPGADRIARGEEWLQTNTLDGQKAHDAFIKIGGPSYFQEFGPAGYHDVIGFANPAIINARKNMPPDGQGDPGGVCYQNPNCNNTVTGKITTARQSRTPDQRLYSSGSRDALSFTQCYVSIGDPDGEDFAFTKCNPDGTFMFDHVPDGSWRLTLFDQWNDQIVDGLATPAAVSGGTTLNMGDIPVQQWHTNIYTRSFIDTNGDGVSDPNNEAGLTLLPTNIRFRDGSYSNFNNTDLNGYAGFNEIFPLFNWYVIEADTTRYKQTGVHVVYDAGGPADGTPGNSGPGSNIGQNFANTVEVNHLPVNLRFPGSVYCDNADCNGFSIANGPDSSSANPSTGRIDPPWVTTEAWQGFIGQNEFIEFGKQPFATGENGGIHGEVIYASTRPFDDPMLLIHTSWTPDVPGVTINLYQEQTATDGTTSLKLVDTTKTTSWDDWAQGFRSGANGAITDINVTSGGSGYSNGAITNLTVTNAGMGYTNGAPTVTITDGNGSGTGARAIATVDPTNYTVSISLIDAGIGYTQPVVTIDAPPAGGTQAIATATSVAPPAVSITDGAGSGAVARAIVNNTGAVEYVEVMNGGSNYSANAQVSITGGGGTGAMASVATGSAIPNMNCPGQDPTSLFFFTLQNSTNWLDPNQTPLPSGSQFKCYDGYAMLNQVQPAPYDGMYKFPSVTSRDPHTGQPTGTSCTACISNPADGTPMLPAGKYVVEMIVPPGYELVKEEDKNILIGDNYIAPVTQQFGGLGHIFILPDQAEVSDPNPYNPQDPTGGLGRITLPSHEGDTGSVETFWPCVGQARVVPDYISLFPQSKEVAPFAGATRNLCDRKEVTLDDQTAALAKFWVFSSAHVAAHFTGIVLDDLTSEFDPFSPQYGEKFAVENVPISFKDHNGVEVSRTYTDQWGLFDGLNYSTWEVNPPNPTGYAPTMMVTCMNDPGPIPDPNHPGQTMIDPLYNPAFSNFCYEIPFMPGQTQYMDTPVVEVEAFAGGYNRPDCAYPDATPAIKTVNGDGNGPWVSQAGNTLTITALGDQQVPNNAYSGPSATQPPFNQKFVTRHYGFGGTAGTVTIGGVAAALTGTGWSDGSIQVTVPSGVPACAVQQQGAPAAQCGELVITAANGRKSIDAVTVTIGGSTPKRVTGENPANNAIQSVIDTATPGDLVMVDPGVYNEMVLMWKPVRLQGAGAASVTINANPHPSGKMDPWRRQVNCLFGLALNGTLMSQGNVYDPTGTYTCDNSMNGMVDPLPLEGVVGWDTTQNGNLAEMLQEPSLMGAYEGAAVTVLGKGETLSIGPGGVEGDFPPGSRELTVADCTAGQGGSNPFPSNFYCNPSRIDGITLTNSSQGGGAVFAHGWNHNLEIANNRVYGNAGTLTGGIVVGQGEFPDATINGDGTQAAYLFDTNVNVHHNSVTGNASYGDELFSATPSAAGGVTFCTGSDYYKFNYNWVCGNISGGDGGGVVHEGFSYNGNISNNQILFNQSQNPTIPAHGGGILVAGAPPDGNQIVNGVSVECGSTPADADCVPGLSDGTGPGLVIDSNLVLGNTAEAGSGGGIRLQGVNGNEIARFPSAPGSWYSVSVTNNIIANNVAGWDGAGISMQDALAVNVINNTIMSNDTTASAGVLFSTLNAGLSSAPPGEVSDSTNLPAGLVTMGHSVQLTSAFNDIFGAGQHVTCPIGHYSDTQQDGNCTKVSFPLIENDMFWQNRAFHIAVGDYGAGSLSQQHVVTLLPSLSQQSTGQCVSGAQYWDIGVRGDANPNTHESGFTLAPTYSVLTDAADYGAAGENNLGSNPNVISQYCNGSRVPPENGGMGYQVPPGVSDATLPNPVFNLTASATVDEGNNWVNMSYGPLSLVDPSGQHILGNYSITASSPAVDYVPNNSPTYGMAPATDFFGNPRPATPGTGVDVGAVEVQGILYPQAGVSTTSMAFGNQMVGTTSGAQAVTLSNTGGAVLNNISVSITGANPGDFAVSNNPCGSTLAPNANCGIGVTFTPTASGSRSASLTIVSNDPAHPTLQIALTGTGVPPATGTLTPASLAFGNQLVNTSVLKTATLTNTGGSALTINSITLSANGNQFTQNNNCPGSLSANASCTFNVTFKPTSTGNKAATITITDNSGGVSGTQQTLSLSGNGVNLIVAPAALNFGNQVVSVPGLAQTLTISNSTGGTRTLTFSIGAPFARATGGSRGSCGNSGSTLNNNNSCTIGIVFSPTQAGSANVQMSITSDHGNVVANSPVSLTGNGVLVGLAPNSWNFGNVRRGARVGSLMLFVLVNSGNSNITNVQQAAVVGGDASDFQVIPLLSTCGPAGNGQPVGTTTLTPGASCLVTAQFKPASGDTTGAKSSTLSVSDSAGTQTSALSGNAQ